MVGVIGFEPTTSCSQSKRATGLRHTPTIVTLFKGLERGKSRTNRKADPAEQKPIFLFSLLGQFYYYQAENNCVAWGS
jgi:hypothetical protein